VHGTLELRVPDAQATVIDAAAVAAFAHALVAWLAARHDGGDLPAPDPTWRIEENRWQACRHGLDGTFADLRTGEPAPAREQLAERIEQLAPFAVAVGCETELDRARELSRENGAERQRRAGGPREATLQLLGEYLA
jgi:carboxylate-amine ligase